MKNVVWFLSILALSAHRINTISGERSRPPLIKKVACFNTILDIFCEDSSELLVFDTAHYGRNDSSGAAICEVPYTASCDLDVQHPLSKACGGKRRCSLAINEAFFGDPCGQLEFLTVHYRCVSAVNIVDGDCLQQPSYLHNHKQPTTSSAAVDLRTRQHHSNARSTGSVFTHASATVALDNISNNGYISSPHYPGRYDMDIDCYWTVTVQPHQQIRLTLYDFELDVKTDGVCRQVVEVHQLSALDTNLLFRDCGSLGQQVIDVNTNTAVVRFTTGQWSLPHRGFILYYEAVGPGCQLINEDVKYYVVDGTLHADVTCDNNVVHHVQCLGTVWNGTRCDNVDAKTPSTTAGDDADSSVLQSFTVPAHRAKTPVNAASAVTTHPPLLVIGLAVSVTATLLTFCVSGCLFIVCYRRRRQSTTASSCPNNCPAAKHCSVNATKCYVGNDEYELCVEPTVGRSVPTSGWNTILPASTTDADQLASLLSNQHQLNNCPAVHETRRSDWPVDCRLPTDQNTDETNARCPDVIPVATFPHVTAGPSHERSYDKCDKCQHCSAVMTSLPSVTLATPNRPGSIIMSTFSPQQDCIDSRPRICIT